MLKWEGNIRQQAAEVITPTRPVDNRKARKKAANPSRPTVPVKGNASNSNRNVEEGCRNGGGSLTFVLAVEQLFEFFL